MELEQVCLFLLWSYMEMRIVSFSGKVVLDELGLDIGAYYCSEIDEDAVLVTRVNHAKSITYLGDVRYVDLEMVSAVWSVLRGVVLVGGASKWHGCSVAVPT